VADRWCWFVLREKYCWLVAGGWFVMREKYCWPVADKPSEKGVSWWPVLHELALHCWIVDPLKINQLRSLWPYTPSKGHSPMFAHLFIYLFIYF
jgi:hypothetical protein